MIVRFKNKAADFKTTPKMSFWVTDLKETSIDVGVVVNGAVLVVAHNLDHLLMQLCSCSVMQARLPRRCGNVWEI